MRRWTKSFLAAVAATMPAGALAHSAGAIPPSPAPDGFTLAAVGDIILLRPMLRTIEAQSPDMLRILRGADAAFGNFEANAFDLEGFRGEPSPEPGGIWLVASPKVPGDLAAMGFDVVSVANNHSTDWGAEGLVETIRLFRDAGISVAGSGRSLQGARQPGYYEGPKARVGLVAANSTFYGSWPAADPLGEMPGRTGVNPLRADPAMDVTKEQFEALSQIARAFPYAFKASSGPVPTVSFGGARFRAATGGAAQPQLSWRLNARDMEGNVRAVRQASENGNLVIFSLHNHEPDNSVDVPADFAREMAHRAIDAGANVVVGHGPHILRGIEIYKGRPIFYSLGNFAMMNTALDAQPSEFYERYGVSPQGAATLPEVLTARASRELDDVRMMESVIPVVTFAKGQALQIVLHPIDLGVGVEGPGRGVPRLASPDEARKILENLQRLSEPFGTTIRIEKGLGYISVAPAHVPTGRR